MGVITDNDWELRLSTRSLEVFEIHIWLNKGMGNINGIPGEAHLDNYIMYLTVFIIHGMLCFNLN